MNELLRFLPAFLAADLILPFILAPFYKGYRHRFQVMSALGSRKSPVRRIYNVWLVMLGLFLLACGPGLYAKLAAGSKGAAAAFLGLLDLYAAGGCLLSGLFPVGETKAEKTLSAQVHGAASAVGFMALAFAPLAAGVWCFQNQAGHFGAASLASFVLALFCFALFVMGDKPAFANTAVAWEGLWQRLALMWMYVPVGMLGLIE